MTEKTKDSYLHFEKKADYSPLLAAHFARESYREAKSEVPRSYINWHEAVELLAVLEGNIHILRGDEIISAHAGELVAVDPFLLHGTVLPSERSELFYIKIAPDFYRECNIPFEEIAYRPLVHDEKAAKLIAHLASLAEDRNAPYFLPRFKAYLILLITHLHEHYTLGTQKKSGTPKRKMNGIIPAIEYIHEHFTERPSIARIAEAAHISESHLLHSFGQVTGTSVLQYVNHLCFLHAKALFATTRLSVSEVAKACGFGSLSYFSKEYTKRMGISPSAARRKSAAEQFPTL